ncbi:transmembrane protein 200A-like [Carassius carassius]|uniref:transmembrane protein 200A-like n=1 Tax=Carassius carassius TaxID=217509 RepID=UPI002868C82A|nr:transmembrane protein 200A-like [Carassius carassius]
MRTQKSHGRGSAMPSRQRLPRFSLHSRRKKEGVIQGKLRIRSMPGAFLVLGVVVVVVGTSLAVAGYWPYRAHRSSVDTTEEGSSGSASGWGLGSKGLFSTASLVHSERMKLLGPVIMGVGLFILICANTVLYENRDRETQMLLAQMRSVICSVSAAVPSADLLQVNSLASHYQWVSSLPAAHLNILCLQEMSSSEPLLQVKSMDEEDSILQQVHTEVLHHQDSSSTPSIHSSSSCNNSKEVFCTEERGTNFALDLQQESHFGLSNCMAASSMSTLGGEDLETFSIPPRRSYSMSHRTKPQILPRDLVHPEDKSVSLTGQHRLLPRQSSSEVCVNMVGITSLDFIPMEEQMHRSWPRLDLGSARKYLKLENKEDSVDKFLDQLEQQCLQLNKSYGSGPFQ